MIGQSNAARAGMLEQSYDVLVIGAGISGIDAGYHLQKAHPGRSFAILERKESFGGTWHTYTFPGIRCDGGDAGSGDCGPRLDGYVQLAVDTHSPGWKD